MAYRDTRVVSQDLSWSKSTGNFAYLLIGITPDWIRCLWKGRFRYPNRDRNIGADNPHVFLYVFDFVLPGRCRVLGIGIYCCDACRHQTQRDDWDNGQTQQAAIY